MTIKFMKSYRPLKMAALTLVSFAICGQTWAIDASGIKTKNLEGADLDLMNNHDPASQLENFELLDGYQVNLFAADPMLANPIHMHWDSKGRLWVACSWSYPQIKPGEVANDKIIILEDTDGDGVADKSTVFAEGLYMPTGIELANGGVYVAQTPDVFFLKDTDGDDVADVKELALTGFGIEDSHHSMSAWRRGPGGWIYFQEGIFLHAQVETQYGVLRNFNGGVYQFNPRTQELRVFCTGTGGNPWGHVFDRWGQSFMVNNPRIMYLSPASGNSGEKIRINPLISTEKQCGGDLATGTHIAEDLRGQLLSGRFKGRKVIRYELIENGAGFSANVLEPLISSKHPNFRPVDVKVGPDGAIYVADWYNSIINHAQHDFRDPRRDHEHGRIWRITHKERPLVEKPQLDGLSIAALVDHLKSPESWTRHQARKELSERDFDEVFTALESWVETLNPDEAEFDHHLVEAMWACQNVERVSEKILTRVLSANDGHARSAGARMLRYWHQDLSDPIAMIAKAAGDKFPRTRMEAVLSAGFVPSAEAYVAALHSIDHPGDPVLSQALPQTRVALEPYWRPAMEAGTLKFDKESHRAYAEQEAGIGLDKRLAGFLKQGSPNEQELAGLQAQLLAVGADREIRMMVDALSKKDGSKSSEITLAMLNTLEKMAPAHQTGKLSRKLAELKGSLKHEEDAIAVAAANNMGAWKVTGSGRYLVSVVKDPTRVPNVRKAAALALAKLGETKYLENLVNLANNGGVDIRYPALAGLFMADLELGVVAATQLFTLDPGDADPVPAILSLLKHRKGASLLAAAVDQANIHPSVSSRVREFHRVSGQLPKNLVSLFAETGSSVSLSKKLMAENQQALTAEVDRLGDPVRGESIFRRKEMACVACHAVGSAGPSIGPNLVAVGAAATTDYMVESILKPNAAIAEHYENRLFNLADGTVQMGVITFKSEKEVVVRDSAQGGKEVSIPSSEILKEVAMPSLMPAGLADLLSNRSEFLDLAKFLSVLGKPGDFANDESPVIRKWRVMPDTAGDQPPEDGAEWMPAYSQVNGVLPAEDLDFADKVWARAYVNVQVEGELELMLNAAQGLSLWIDGERVDSLAGGIELKQGRHQLTFFIDQQKRGSSGLRVQLKAVDNQVRFQPEGGL